MLFSFLFDFFLLVQPCVSVSDADPEAGIAGAEMAASFSFGREAQLVSPFLLLQFHAKTPTEGREKKNKKDAACHCCFWVRIAPGGTHGDLHPLRVPAILFLCP